MEPRRIKNKVSSWAIFLLFAKLSSVLHASEVSVMLIASSILIKILICCKQLKIMCL